jgi:hypothetical protein
MINIFDNIKFEQITNNEQLYYYYNYVSIISSLIELHYSG